MIESKSSAPAHPSTRTTREDRSRALAAEHHHEIAASRRGHEYLVPSCSADHAYRVHYDPAGDAWCLCPDWQYRNNVCKHILAAALVWAGIVPADTSRRVDERWCLEASEFASVPYWVLSDAFLGLPQERRGSAVGVLKAAVRAGGSIAERERFVLDWAKSRGKGMYHPAMLEAPELTFEQTAHARRVSERAMREERS